MESISVFDIIKVGIGPSSSHTMGPWEASLIFTQYLKDKNIIESVTSVKILLYGSLAKTGRGHGTDFALTLGLGGYDYKLINTDMLTEEYHKIVEEKTLFLGGVQEIPFENDIEFHNDKTLDEHPNGMTIIAYLKNGDKFERTFFSVGGGFIQELGHDVELEQKVPSKYPCHTGESILNHCKKFDISVSQLIMINESTWASEPEVRAKALLLWGEMKRAIWKGCQKSGELPGYLRVKRRAGDLYKKFVGSEDIKDVDELILYLNTIPKDFNVVNKWISIFALAVNEENASFGRIVTAPTNGAAGVLPAVLMYAVCFLDNIDNDKIVDFILTAGEIGSLFKKSATISAALGGCQAEIGVSSAMAAAALTEILRNDPPRVLMAAEIAMEHHLGMTCDPVGGLVQIPCIERNTMGAIKAITASNIAIESNPEFAKVSLDKVIQTMWETAMDMSSKYKETSEAGLATNISVNIAEC